MKKTTVLCVTHDRPQMETSMALNRLAALGAPTMLYNGLADVALARSLFMTRVLYNAHTVTPAMIQGPPKPPPGRDVLLLVDDDMLFQPEVVQELVSHCRMHQRAVSAAYVTNRGGLAAMPMPDGKGWLVGLGLIAIPMVKLVELAARSTKCSTVNKEALFELTWTGSPKRTMGHSGPFAEGGITVDQIDGLVPWLSEDYRLCYRLGGVDMLPLKAAHLKMRALLPNDVQLDAIRAETGPKLVLT